MSMADKLTTIAENQQRVYDAGYAKGKAEGGGDVGIDYDAFWDAFQNNGQAQDYSGAFRRNRFDDTTYDPKHPIVCGGSNEAARYMFDNNTKITDTKVPIDVTALTNTAVLTQTFCCFNAGAASALQTIRELRVLATTDYPNTFMNCASLKNITIVGTIGKSISLAQSPLTKESIMSVFNALSTEVTGQTATFKKTAVDAAFSADEWEALKATKTNWTYALS